MLGHKKGMSKIAMPGMAVLERFLTTQSSVLFALLLVLLISALSVVAMQHKTRKLFIELQKEKDRAHQMEVEWGQLQLEQSTWAMSARVEKISAAKLQMQLPQSGQIRFVRLENNIALAQVAVNRAAVNPAGVNPKVAEVQP